MAVPGANQSRQPAKAGTPGLDSPALQTGQSAAQSLPLDSESPAAPGIMPHSRRAAPIGNRGLWPAGEQCRAETLAPPDQVVRDPFLEPVMSGEEGWDAQETIHRAIEIRNGIVQNPKILSFQSRSPTYPHPRLSVPHPAVPVPTAHAR